jgi:hypothetical protein
MGATVMVNQMTVVHKTSGGMVSFMPDVCLTPAPPGPPVPVPYPNIALSQDATNGSQKVTCDGNPIMLQSSSFSKSTGDEAGTAGGVVSGSTKGAAEFSSYSFDVLVEGKSVARLGDLMLGNKGGTFNTPPVAEVQPPLPPIVMVSTEVKQQPDALHVTVVDRDGKPVKDVRYTLMKPDGTTQEGRTDSSGKIELQETITGHAKIIFPDLVDTTVTVK